MAIFANFPSQNPFQKFAKPGCPLQFLVSSFRRDCGIYTSILIARLRYKFTIFTKNLRFYPK
ncbi:hypothetical protein C3729_00905 [Cloacibacterium normanense]|uniref:Uncharacterized protein n=1 Tax=Cloacibacterium normanense TaxID=237258 RepID=A0A2S7I7U0_9FLAO|nr:hypothetical protein C3729_00905 [Cloacibacterium normanense]